MKKLKEWLSIQVVKNPGRIVLAVILLINVVFFLISSGLISLLSQNLSGNQGLDFISATYRTISMILDAGCIETVVGELGQGKVIIAVVCVIISVLGMILFTGAVIGYVTNYISSFIENANAGKRRLNISNHFVILNWNNRASEIINDMLYCDEKQRVVVLVQDRKEEIKNEIDERITDTVMRENIAVAKSFSHLPFFRRLIALKKNRFVSKVTVIVREGDIFSTKQLMDISLKKARSVIILSNDNSNSICRFGKKELMEEDAKGNSQTIKTLMQVADIVSANDSFDNQRVIVEIDDKWTLSLVDKIISAKQVKGKCNIIPLKINEILGQLFSQFCLMPELNDVYSELLSSRGVEFYSRKEEEKDETEFARKYLESHNHAIPITCMEIDGENYAFFVGENEKDVEKKSNIEKCDYSVELVKDYWLEKRRIIILGHNSNSHSIMAGFESFSNEWKKGDEEIIEIVVVDGKQSLEKMNYYKDYSFVAKTVESDVFDTDIVYKAIIDFIGDGQKNTSILILSDDSVSKENLDAVALANLVYVQDIVNRKVKEEGFNSKMVDVIVEIIDPKHHDIVSGYSINNVVISNRYISKMVSQISEVEAIFNLYNDILSYDEGNTQEYDSNEIYVKKVKRYFREVPKKTTADKLIRGLFNATSNKEDKENYNPSIMLGYVKANGEKILFGGDLSKIEVELTIDDKVILFSPH